MNCLSHPDLNIAASSWSEDQTLHIAACYSNPFRWQTRRELANDFRRHVTSSPNTRLHLIELAYGDRPFEVTDDGELQVRTSSELFHKENLLSLAIRSFPPGWKYGAIVDADFHFTRHDWALETIHQLQHHDWVQMFSSYADLSGETQGVGHRVIGTNNGFAFNYISNGRQLPRDMINGFPDSGAYGGRRVGATGGAWAFTRDALDNAGGLLDRCILGHADWFMTFGLVGAIAPDMRMSEYHPNYHSYIESWQRNAYDACSGNIGYVDCFATHGYHGSKSARGYSTRDQILVQHKYDPLCDVAPDWQGVLQLMPSKPRLRDDVRRYFLSRNEDST